MSWNSMCKLGTDVVLGDVVAKTITCENISILNPNDENLTVETITADNITATTGNIETLNSQTGNISNLQSDDITCPVFHLTANYDSQNISNPKCTNGITIGTKDSNGYNYEDVNLQINSWNSSGFVDTENKICNLTIDHRNGNLQTKGNITGNTADFDVINVATLNISNPDDPTNPANINCESITANSGNIENLTTDTIASSSITVTSSLGCNSLNSQNTTSDDITANNILTVAGSFEALTATKESTTPLLGLDAITTGDYLQQISSVGDNHYSLVQLASGDDGSQSIILTAGGPFDDGENTIQSFDSMRNNALTLNLNPLGGKVIIGDDVDVSGNITANNILNVAGTLEALNATSESTTPLLGLDAITTGDYLQQISGDDDSHFSLLQLSSGDSGSQSIILSAGGSFATGENSIQSFDSKLDNALTLNLNPLGGKVVTDNLTFTNNNKPVQAKPLTSSAMPNMEVLFFHLTGTVEQETATMLLANNISGTRNYAVFPSIYYGYSGSSDTYHVYDSYFNINVSNFTETQFFCNIKKGSGDAANIYIQFLVIYDVEGTDFPKSY